MEALDGCALICDSCQNTCVLLLSVSEHRFRFTLLVIIELSKYQTRLELDDISYIDSYFFFY